MEIPHLDLFNRAIDTHTHTHMCVYMPICIFAPWPIFVLT